jgi:hypothetical protein
VNAALARRIGRLERARPPIRPAPTFVLAPDAGAAGREVERLLAGHGERPPKALFVMTRGRAAAG